MLDDGLKKVLDEFCSSHNILIASDFDGTLSRITAHPSEAVLESCARVALRVLSEFPATKVCIISGRALEDLTNRCDGLTGVRFVGSHGFEFDRTAQSALTLEQKESLHAAEAIMKSARQMLPQSELEFKPCSIALHFRMADPTLVHEILPEIELQLRKLPGGSIKPGRMVIEFAAAPTDKGLALTKLRESFGSTAVIFFGDDATDEDAFRQVGTGGVAIKVGDGDSVAHYRLSSVESVCQALEYLVVSRGAAYASFPRGAIQEHLLLSDRRSFALLDACGAIVWQCFPNLDSPPIFASLLGGPGSGYFSIESTLSHRPHKQDYVEGSLGVVTQWDHLRIADFLNVEENRSGSDQGSRLIRIVEGSGECRVVFSPRIDFGRVPTKLSIQDNELRIEGAQQQYLLRCSGWNWRIENVAQHQTATAVRKLENERCSLEFCALSTADAPIVLHEVNRESTNRIWSDWSNSLQLPELHREAIKRSALTLSALCFAPTGAIAAAATTSLPETIGGVRNWDYRFCWLRDAAFAAAALLKLGDVETGNRFLDWFFGLLAKKEPMTYLAPVYAIDGSKIPGEAELPELWGYRGSRPVRVGNLAAQQLQLDVLGPVIHLWAKLCKQKARDCEHHVSAVSNLLELIQTRWREPDSGIWEIRGPQRHYVYSKVMCWFAVAETLRLNNQTFGKFESLEAEIRADIEKRGYSDTTGTYLSAYDLASPDASLLWLSLTGFHPASDPRIQRTIRWVQERLLDGDTVYRYTYDDNLPGHEGGFHICLAWLIEALAKQGEITEAKTLLERLVACGAPHGLYAEEWDPKARMALGNFPQAYSHTGLIDATLAVEAAMK